MNLIVLKELGLLSQGRANQHRKKYLVQKSRRLHVEIKRNKHQLIESTTLTPTPPNHYTP